MSNDETMQRLRAKLDELIVTHNQYIDSVWRGTADINNPPKTVQEILQALAAEIERAEVEAEKKVNNWFISQANKVAKVFNEPVDEHRVTLESIIIAAQENIKELEFKTGGDNAKG